jgi:hypothetical protein
VELRKKGRLKRHVRWSMRKYYRWLRLYMKKVRMTEREIGGELQAC